MHVLYCYLLLLTAASSHIATVLAAAPSIELGEKSYVIVAQLFITDTAGRNYLYAVQEYHSAWQKRSRVSYQAIDLPEDPDPSLKFPVKASLYSDGTDLLLRDEDTGSCQRSPNDLADKLFNLNQLKRVEFSSIVGPSRLLHFASANANNLHSQKDVHDMLEYSFTIQGQNSMYYLYYFRDAGRNLPHGIPARLHLSAGQYNDYILTYNFERVDILPSWPLFGQSGSLNRQENARIDPLALEWFAVEPFTGCDQVLRKGSGTFAKVLSQDLRFSFEAQSDGMTTFVGFEPSIKTLRVDRISKTRSTETLTNFHSGLKYHLMRRLSERDLVMDKLVKVQAGKGDEESLCIVTKAATATTTNSKAQGSGLGSMLFGSSELAYLGMAQVRGIEARAYLAYESGWPIWIQQPVEYYTSPDWIAVSNSTVTRPTVDQNSDLFLVSLIYLTYTEKEEDQFRGNPLMMEIHTIDKRTKKWVETRSFQIYDFSWHFSGDSPTGLSSERFYSLADSCSSPSTDDNHYGQIDLMMQFDLSNNEPGTSSSTDWLSQPRKRDFAIMRAAQDATSLSASIVYDIESRYQVITMSDRESGLQKRASVAASLRLVERVRFLVQLIYIGRGAIDPERKKNFIIFKAASFHSCNLIASHRKVGLVFAFDPRKTHCYIYTKSQVIGNVKMTIKENFEIYSAGYLEVYRIRHFKERKLEDELSELINSYRRLSSYSKLLLIDPSDDGKQVLAELKSVASSELNEKAATQVDELSFFDSNKFIGFGLVESHKHSRLIQPSHLSKSGSMEQGAESSEKFAHMLSAMTFGQCRAACMADFDCESFSVCIKSARTECILSKISFRSEMLLLQLLQSLDTKPKLNSEFELFLEDGADKIKVKRHPGCELHNKLYSDFFLDRGRDLRVNLLQRFLRPARDRENCAKMCLDRTLSTMRDEVEGALEASWSALNQPETNLDSIGMLFEEYKRKHAGTCSTFYYLEQSDFIGFGKERQDALQRQFIGHPENELTNGYCILGASLTDVERQVWKEANNGQEPDKYLKLEVSVSRHDFDFSALFEQQHGVSLVESKMGVDELAAYNQLITRVPGHNITDKQFEALKLFVQMGENIVSQWTFRDANECARLCFQQQVMIWPGCRSFDVVEIEVYSSRRFRCYFSSISLADAYRRERFDLIRNNPGDQEHVKNTVKKVTKVTHYEPRTDFVARSISLATQLSMDETYLEQVAPSLTHYVHMGYFGLFMTVVLALVFGVGSGVMMGVRVLIPRLRAEPEDVETLVDRLNIEFSNLVDHECRVRESHIDQARPEEATQEGQKD